MSHTAEEILAQIDDLPSLPALVMDVLNSIDDDSIPLEQIAHKVQLDSALTAKTLRLANSACFSRQVKVSTLSHALSFLGMSTTKNLIIAAALTGCFPQGLLRTFDYKAFWRHSISSAVCARAIARHLRFNQDYAFTAGLLHDIGRLALASQYPEEYARVVQWRAEHDSHWIAAEQACLGLDHVAAGVALAKRWHLSGTLQLAIAGHHLPDAPGAGFLAAIVHLADCISHGLDLCQVDDEHVPPVSIIAWNALGLSDEALHQIFAETEMQTAEVSRILLG
ncbi:HDOD domain-containing protein [Massilia sp. W12]|uniref:HDOD domain-containing protein n=1 Tax=Massilia sp. W12 TaxID=3126507 RepID=UPI0030D2E442